MRAAVTWVLSRTALYLAIAAAVLIGVEIAASRHVALSKAAPALLEVLLILGAYVCVVLLPLAAVRKRLPGAALKVLLGLFLLIPAVLVDLAGARPPVILVLLGIQAFYLIVVRT